MTFITLAQVSNAIGLSERTIRNRIRELEAKELFKKKYPGRTYTIDEMQTVCSLLNIVVNLQKAASTGIKQR